MSRSSIRIHDNTIVRKNAKAHSTIDSPNGVSKGWADGAKAPSEIFRKYQVYYESLAKM